MEIKRVLPLFLFFSLLAPAAFAQAPAGIDSGDVAWVAASAVLVMLMTPALGFFYGGLVRAKNLLSVLTQSMAIFAVMGIVWALVGFSLAFGSGNGFIGSLEWIGLNGVGEAPFAAYAATIPLLLFFFFQLKFAAITPALIIGAFAERIRFSSLLVFTVLWAILVYAPIAHWVWGVGGWLRALGALDFAGGTVVHIAAGFSALAAALVVGKRRDFGRKSFHPNNIPFVILGAALLWFGWFGFNGGSALAANGLAVTALVTTNLAAASAAFAWMVVDRVSKGKVSATGIAIGAVCGLVAITPASGFVTPLASILIGLVAGLLCNFVANWRASRNYFDDSLDVFACHGVGGVWGAIATGLFASVAVNSAGANGLFYGNPKLLVAQVIAVVSVAAFSFIGSFVLLKAIDAVHSLRVSPKAEEEGLDSATHGEIAYR
ncbi:MAG: ammonium transporter [Candidatus Diapherotrites archaeon]|nr:ammonium transporter [Candidatus Diapherotrites archaeon]